MSLAKAKNPPLARIRAGRGRDGFQLFIGVGLGNIGLLLKRLLDKFPDRIIAGAAHAIHIIRGFLRPVVLRQREILENEVGSGLQRK